MNLPLIVSLSPRAGGNSDQAAALFAHALHGPTQTLWLRDHHLLPCTGCGACEATGSCPFAQEDEAEALFVRLDGAPGLVLAAPVYFYHLPAQSKVWIDRAQARYMARRNAPSASHALRPAYILLVAGRSRGEHLFSGILATLRLFLALFDFQIQGTALLRGLDAAGDFSHSFDAREEVARLARGSGW